MKKIATTILIGLVLTSIGSSCIFAKDVKSELTPKKYVKTLKLHIKKDEFEELERFCDMGIISQIKSNNKGVQLVYIEPTIEKIESNQAKVKELVSFIKNNTTNDKKINDLSSEMLNYLSDMSKCLDSAHDIYKKQLGFELSDEEKLKNLGNLEYWNKDEDVTYAYDYINLFNNRVEKVNRIYTHIKDKL